MTHPEEDGAEGYKREALPVAASELAPLFERLKSFKTVVLAVSGGADSMGLMLLAARWLGEQRGGNKTADPLPHIEVVTIDHRLRPESAAEARFVCEHAQALGFTHTTLTWDGPKPALGIQDAARSARYQLLAEHARKGPGPQAVVTAHTEDDQAETLLMRLARGSGVDGLAAMRAERPLPKGGQVMLLRPLLGLAKARLVATLEQAGQTWIEDPSNELETFERARLRRARSVLEAAGLTADKLALSAARLGRARQALEAATLSFLETHVKLNAGVFASVDRHAFSCVPREVRVRALASMLDAFGGSAPRARLAQIETVEALIETEADTKRTLGGCVVSAGPKWIRVFREPEGRDLPQMEISTGEDAIWDRRFEISLPADLHTRFSHLPHPPVIRAIGKAGYATLRSHLKCRLPSWPAASLPALWAGEELIGVPDFLCPDGPDDPAAGERSSMNLLSFKTKFVSGWGPISPADEEICPSGA